MLMYKFIIFKVKFSDPQKLKLKSSQKYLLEMCWNMHPEQVSRSSVDIHFATLLSRPHPQAAPPRAPFQKPPLVWHYLTT